MAQKKNTSKTKETRRRYTDVFKDEAVQMMLDEVTAINPKHLAGDKDGCAALSDHHADEATDNVRPNVISERDHGIEPQP